MHGNCASHRVFETRAVRHNPVIVGAIRSMAAEYQHVDPANLNEFLKARPYSVIHLDAAWNGQRIPVQKSINALMKKIDDTSFGYIDIDAHQDHVRTIPILNIPSCSYYRGIQLVATVIGMQQDVEQNLQIVRDGGIPETSNRLSRM